MTKAEYRRTTKAELARRLKETQDHAAKRLKELRAAQNELDDMRLEQVNIKTKIENVEASVTPLREMLDDSKRQVEAKQNELDGKQEALASCWKDIDAKAEAIAELKHQRNCCGVVAALFAALGAAALYSLIQQ